MYSLSILRVSESTYNEIKLKFEELGPDYAHLIRDDGRLDVSELALEKEPK